MPEKPDKYAWFKFFPKDWMNEYALRACSPAARGVWIDACCIAWDAPKRGTLTYIKDDQIMPMPCEMLAAVMRIECATLASLLDELLANGVCSKSPDGTIYSRRMVRMGDEIQTRRACASNAARMRWACVNDADVIEKSEVRSKSIERNTPPTPPRGNGVHKASKAEILEARFNTFWTTYPRKIGKTAALKAWKRIAPDQELTERIIAAVTAQRTWPAWTKEQGQYIPHPATWLNQGRWDDEPDTTSAPTGGGIDWDKLS